MFGKLATSSKQTKPIDGATVDLWRARREQLRDKLAGQDQAEWAWLWRTRVSVLDYLIHRYDSEQESNADQGVRQVPFSQEERKADHSDRLDESVEPYSQKPVDGTSWIADQKKDAIQSRLASLQSANIRRHAEAEKQAEAIRASILKFRQATNRKHAERTQLGDVTDTRRDPVSPVLQAEREKAERLRLAEALGELDEREYKDLRRCIAFDLGMLDYTYEALDEETIRLILAEHDIDPSRPD